MAQFRGFIGANFESIKHELEELNLRRVVLGTARTTLTIVGIRAAS